MTRKKVAILGGGAGALSAAFELTELDTWGDRCEITVYQLGWRLGGKGAVGRNPGARYRVEEHGLHVWTGFYDNAFYLVDRCYGALERMAAPVPFGSRSRAFKGLDAVTLMQEYGGTWFPWRFELPPAKGIPGDFDSAPFVTLVDYVRSLVHGARRHYLRSRRIDRTDALALTLSLKKASIDAAALPRDPNDVTAEQRDQLRTQIKDAHKRVTELLSTLPRAEGVMPTASADLVDTLRDYYLLDLALGLAEGLLIEAVFGQGFDALDSIEWTQWMKSNNCRQESLDSGIVQGCYDYVFGFVRGVRNVAAGTGTRLLLKLLFGYKGSFFFVMQASMGEMLFAPLYTVLKKRGVRFEFFHRVERLHLSADKTAIEAIDMTVQATPKDGEYCPLISISDGCGGELDSWPSHPKYECLNEGDAIRAGGHDLESAWTAWPGNHKTLQFGPDFDQVVLGIGFGAFASICKPLVDALPDWAAMVGSVETTATMALQLWTTCETNDLLEHPPTDCPTITSAFAKPLDTWGDLSLMLGQETWPQPDRPKGLHYFVGSFVPHEPAPPAPDEGYPVRQLNKAKALMRTWIEHDLGKLWPGFLDAQDQVRWTRLFDPQNRQGQERLEAQYPRVNINPSDRYVLSIVDSTCRRMRAGDSGVDNLYLAGDWVRTGLNAGCVESAIMAGRGAAGAITGVEIDMPNANDFNGSGFVDAFLPGVALFRKLRHGFAAGTGRTDAYCTIMSLPTSDVQARLPDGVVLANPRALSQDVVLIFAHQRDVRPGVMPVGGLAYDEVYEVIPEVELEKSIFGPNFLFSFMPNLLVDQLLPVLVGQRVYGFNKQLARIVRSGGSFDVRSKSGATRAQFTSHGLPGSIAQFTEIDKIQKKLQLPLIGQSSDGSFIVSVPRFEVNGATFQRTAGDIQIGAPFLPPMRVQFAANANTTPWGFRMESRWQLSVPVDDIQKLDSSEHNRRDLLGRLGESTFGRFPPRR